MNTDVLEAQLLEAQAVDKGTINAIATARSTRGAATAAQQGQRLKPSWHNDLPAANERPGNTCAARKQLSP